MGSVKRDFSSTAPVTVPTHDVVSAVDPVTGTVTDEAWYKDGKLDRADGPAVIFRDPVTGTNTHESWWKDGVEIERPQRPASPIPGAPAP